MFFQVVIFVAVAALVRSEVTVEDCPHQLYRYGNLRAFDHSCYVFFTDYRRDFRQAERFCQTDGGHLATIRDLRTQDFLYKTMQRGFRYSGKVWIGLTDFGREGHFHWTEGSSATYTNWASGQPSSLGGILQNCVYMDTYRGGRWYDDRCTSSLFHSSRYPFICEYALRKRTTPTTTTTTTTTIPSTTTMRSTTTTAATITQQPTTTSVPATATNIPQTQRSTAATTPKAQPQSTSNNTSQTQPTTTTTTTTTPTQSSVTTSKPQPSTPTTTTSQPQFTTPTPTPTRQPLPTATAQPSTLTPISTTTTSQPQFTTPTPATTPRPLPTATATTQAPTPSPTPTTTLKATSAATSATPKPTASQTTSASGGCPTFNCSKACGLLGYQFDSSGCLLCECSA